MIKRISAIFLIFILSIALITGCDIINKNNEDNSQDLTNNTTTENGDENQKPSEPNDDYSEIDYDSSLTVTVTLEADNNSSVIGTNPQTVKVGENAKFPVVFNTNYTFLNVEGNQNVVYSAGYVTVKNCQEDTVVKMSSALKTDLCSLRIQHTSPTFGIVELSVAPGNVLKNSIITATAKPSENQTFIGWSKNGSIVNGGTVVSCSQQYSFEIKEDTKLYPNFLTEGYTIIKYDLNGGTTDDGMSEVIITQYKSTNHQALNLIADDGKIVRPGYTLLEFTENRDGSGLAVNPGGMTKLAPIESVMTFYAQWSKWTPKDNFLYTVNNSTNEATIKSCTTNPSTISIPMEIDGFKVTAIANGAFIGKSFETLVIPRTVTTVQNGAFQNCKSFDTLYITDSFNSIYNDAFLNCKAFSNLRLNASLPPHFVSHAESISCRFENILERDEDKNMIMFVGGSSCLYGIKSDIVEKELGYKYQILNCGTNAGGTGILYMEALSHFMKDGDIIVNLPEYGSNQMGGVEIVWRTFRAMIACYNLFRYVDFSKYTNFFTAMTEFNTDSTARYAGSPETYDQKNSSLAFGYCDLTGYRGALYPNDYYTQSVNAGTMSNSRAAVINNLHSQLQKSDIKYYFSCAPICYYNAKGTQSTDEQMTAYLNAAKSKLNCEVISNPLNYRYDNKTDYSNSAYHLCTDAAEKHTMKVIDDLKRVLN